jgi:hypothetical protein
MAVDTRSIVLTVAIIALVLVGLYLIDPTMFNRFVGSREGFESTMGADANYQMNAGQNDQPGKEEEEEVKKNPHSAGGDATETSGFKDLSGEEGFANMEEVSGPAAFGGAEGPAGCYPRDQLTPSELLPRDGNSVWAQQNPMGTGSLKGKNFLSAGALIGVNTVGQSMRNANLQLRSEPANPQNPVSVFYNSTIEPDTNRRDFEVN